MKTTRKLLLTGTVGALIPLALYASDQVNGMYTFVDGEPILTEEVNENFQHLAGLINSTDNVAHISVDDVTGNVGIGTTSPTYQLQMSGASTTSLRALGLNNTDTTPGASVHINLSTFNTTTGLLIEQSTNSIGPATWASGSYDAFIRTSQLNSKLHFGAGNKMVPNMTIGATGNVGIGTTTPGVRLTVIGDALNHDIVSLNRQDVSADWRLGIQSSGDFFIGDATASTERLTIDTNGNVGIGTTTPNERLEVAGTIRSNYFNARFPSGASLWLQATGEDSRIFSESNLPLRIGTSGDTFMLTILPNGNVGIGTTTPSEKLHVNGNILASGLVSENSDLRLKTDIAPLENASEGIACLEGVTYRWNDPASSQDLQIGLIAQDVERCFPEVVTTDPNGYKSVSYARLVAPLIENAKEQQSLNATQQLEIARVKAELATTNARLARLEALLSRRQ